MLRPSFAERISASFYAWEVRGRGWQLTPYPVALEPPFRYCRLLPSFREPPVPEDDGRRPTFLSSLADLVRGAKTSTPTLVRADDTPFEEPEPFPACETDALTTLTVYVPGDFASPTEVAGRLLSALSASLQPLSVEWIGSGGKVTLQIACRRSDTEHLVGSLAGYVPEAVVLESEDLLGRLGESGQERLVIDFGLSEEFFLPLRTFSSFGIDPAIPLVTALAQTHADELLCLQILFARAANPWGNAIRHALTAPDGGAVFEDAPEFQPLAKEKTGAPLYAAVLRVVAQAETKARAWSHARATGAFILQFSRAGANELIPLENDGYSDEDHLDAVMNRTSFRTGMLLSEQELAGFVHLPDASLRHPALAREEKRAKAVPESGRGRAAILGENVYRGVATPVGIGLEERLQHMHIVGASGMGKSTLLVDLICQDIRAGHGLAVLDPHGDLIEEILARIPEERVGDVAVFDPADEEWPIGFNILAAENTLEKQLLASDLVSIFERLSTSWGDTMNTVLANAVLALLESTEGGTLLELRRFLVDDRFRKEYLETVPDHEIRFFWQRSFALIGARSIGPILSRLDAFLRSKLIRHMVGQKDGKLRLQTLMHTGGIFLGKLSQGLIGTENMSLLGSLLLSKFHQLALARQRLSKAERRPFFIYADECQHFVTPSVGSLLSEGRKYGVGLVLAHQHLGQIRGSAIEGGLLGSYTRIAFRVGDEDARKLSEGFSFFEAHDVQGLGRGEALVRLGSAGSDCNLRTQALPPLHEDEAEARRAAVRTASRDAFAVARDAVRQVLEAAYTEREEAEKVAPKEEGTTTREPAVSATPQEERRVPREEAPPAGKKTPKSVPVTSPMPGRGGAEHKYLQHLIKRLGEERGFRGIIEEPVGDGRVDVVLRKEELALAWEISITTDPEHEVENMRKCLSGDYSHFVMVVPDTKRRETLRKKLAEALPDCSIAVLSPEEIVPYLENFRADEPPLEQTVRGYKVRVTRQRLSPEEVASRRSAVAEVIARSVSKAKR